MFVFCFWYSECAESKVGNILFGQIRVLCRDKSASTRTNKVKFRILTAYQMQDIFGRVQSSSGCEEVGDDAIGDFWCCSDYFVIMKHFIE